MWRIATEIHKMRTSLSNNGHPHFQHGPKERMIADGEKTTTLDFLYQSQKEYQQLLVDWEKNQRDCLARNARLILLRNKQLLSLIEQMETIKSQGEGRDDNICFESLIPYIKICFPEVPQEMLRTEAILGCLDDAKEDDLLQRVSRFILSIGQRVGVMDEGEDEGESRMKVVQVPQVSSMDLLGVIFDLCDLASMPTVEEIMWCDGSITKRDVSIFMRRTTSFPEKKFFIVGVNKLTNALREELLKYQMQVLQKQLETADTFLIFTENIGTEMFSHLENHKSAGVSYQNLRPALQKVDFLASLNITELEYVVGLSRNGKTTYIERKINEACQHNVVTSVNEDWEAIFLQNKLDAIAISSGVVGIYFKLSQHAPLELFERFLFHLIFGGILVDEESGLLRRLNPAAEWRIFIEIPIPEMANSFALLRLFGKKIQVDDLAFIVGDELRLVCAFLQLFNTQKMEETPLDEIEGIQDDDTCRALLLDAVENKCRKVGNLKFRQAMFVKLLWNRCVWLQKMYSHNQELEKEEFIPSNYRMAKHSIKKRFSNSKVKNWYHNLFYLFLEECDHYCNEDLRYYNSLRRTSPPFSQPNKGETGHLMERIFVLERKT